MDNLQSVCMMVGHIKPMASESLLTTTGEMTRPVKFEHNGEEWSVKLGVQFESLKRPAAMPDAMNYATERFRTRMELWLATGTYSTEAYDIFACELVAELDACFGPRYGAVFRGIALYGLETLPMLVGASGLWQAPVRSANPGWWWE
ncbi:MAG TPA: hypothetical protein VHP58_01900 [Alphaproteobacteria bacterium]|nr:hypothetical protein [Alphaproteobacteria bacterium]